MMRSAFSTVASPAWTLSRVCGLARELRYDGVELRTFGYGNSDLACDPAHSAPEKILRMFDDAGVAITSLATSLRFDAPISPPVIGRAFGDYEAPVRSGKRMIDLARDLGCPFVRVFAFEKHGREKLDACAKRIGERLFKIVDHSRNTGVRVLIENGGSFPTAASLVPIIEAADLQGLLGVSYSAAVGQGAGETVEAALDVLGDRIQMVKVKEVLAGKPAALGEGELKGDQVVQTLRERGFDAWVVYENDQLWAGSQSDPTEALAGVPAMVLGRKRAS